MNNNVIVHIITSLSIGGAEMMLLKILKNRQNKNLKQIVICLTHEGPIAKQLQNIGIEVHILAMRKNIFFLYQFWQLCKMIKQIQPTVIHAWMYHSMLIHYFLKKFKCTHATGIWNIRQTTVSLKYQRLLTAMIIKFLKKPSYQIETVVYNSMISQINHQAMGYSKDNVKIISNGFELNSFSSRNEAKNNLAQLITLPNDACIIGHVARYHSIKGHEILIKSFSLVQQKISNAYLIMVGRNVNHENKKLSQLISHYHCQKNIILLGEISETNQIMAAFDVYASSSWGEGFPNVIGEAMCCGIPCVVTDVGDCARLVGDTGIIVNAGDINELAAGIVKSLSYTSNEKEDIYKKTREKMKNEYSIATIVSQYEHLYNNLINQPKNTEEIIQYD